MLNWLTRYAFVHAELDFDASGALRDSVLDVGCGPHGLATVAPAARFAGVDLLYPAPVAPGMFAFRNEPGPLPFEDGAFDTVLCLDVLEHLPAVMRERFVAELARVSARRVLIACPSIEGAFIDDMLRVMYAERGIPAPGWLNEHDEHGLPTAAEIELCCRAAPGTETRELAMTNGLLSTVVVLADMMPELAERAAREWRDHREHWTELFQQARFGPCHRKGYAVERSAPITAIVDAQRFDATVWDAVRCPACAAAALERAVCRACGHRLGREPSGAFDLSAPSRRRLDVSPIRTAASVRLLHSPDWERPADWLPVVARYVAGARAGGDTVLCLDATTGSLPLSAIHEMISIVAVAVAGGEPFADMLLLDAPYARDGLIPVATAADVAERLALEPAPAPASIEAIAEQARAAKLLHDELRRVIDVCRYGMAEDPWASPTPLVSVRIATWRGHRLLVERTIPSVLNGSYANVEVVVCSDGPDPEARAAVEGIADRRVRYLELPKRPDYPEQPWSFWETAGIHAVNLALDHCAGAFIAPLDHDDAFTHDHIAVLLDAARAPGADLVYGQALMEDPGATWRICGSAPLAHGHITHGSVLYSRRLGHLRMDADCWLRGEPGDWNMWRRITELGAEVRFVPQIVLVHFRERTSIASDGGGDVLERMTRTPQEIVADLTRTGLDWLLDVPLHHSLVRVA
jgi:SAM-dependent methyltransferase